MCARQVILAGTFCMMYVRDFAGKRFDVRRPVDLGLTYDRINKL
jgi:hypothetical protein